MKYSIHEYLGFDPFEGDRDDGARNSTVKLVKVRKPHFCHLSGSDDSEGPHDVKKGEYARREKCIYEGEWVSYYCCLPCMDAWFEEIGIYPENELTDIVGKLKGRMGR